MKKFLYGFVLLFLLVIFLSVCAGTEQEKETHLPELVLLTLSEEEQRLHAQAFQEMWRDNLGIDVRIESVDQAAYMERLKNGDFSFYYIGWGADYCDPQTFLEICSGENPYNFTGWEDERYDNLLEESKFQSGIERDKLLAQAEQMLLEKMPVIPLYWPSRTYLLKEGTENLIPRAVGAVNEYKWCSTVENRLRLNINAEPAVLDPQKCYDIVSMEILNATFEGLVRPDKEGRILPGSGLAKEWNISPDGLRYTFYLREAYWSDGTPVTAEDFICAWKRAVDPRTGAPSAYKFFDIKGALEVAQIELTSMDEASSSSAVEQGLKSLGLKAPNDKTLEVELVHPVPYFLELVADPAFFPVPSHLDGPQGPIPANPEEMVSNGPFIIKERSPGSKIVLAKNEYYWDKPAVNLDEIHFAIIPDPGAALAEFERGELELAIIPGTLTAGYADRPELKFFTEAAVYFLGVNTKDPLLSCEKIRRAFALALDRQNFVKNVLGNSSRVATSFTPPPISTGEGISFASLVGEHIPPCYDNRARELFQEGLAELGY